MVGELRKVEKVESINPTLQFVISIRRSLQRGDSVLKSAQKSLHQKLDRDLQRQLIIILKAYQDGKEIDWGILKSCSLQRRSAFMVIYAGLCGKPIFDQLCQLEEEILYQIEIETEVFLSTLPVLSMVPLAFLIFPAFMLLLLGPLVRDFFNMLGAN